jgi:hypothetical protein
MMRRWVSAFLLTVGLIAAAGAADIVQQAPTTFGGDFFERVLGVMRLKVALRVADNTALATLTYDSAPYGVVRSDFAAGLGAGDLSFVRQLGTCAFNGLANDGGLCTDADGGNSFKALYGTEADAGQWGVKCDYLTAGTPTDNTTPLRAAALALDRMDGVGLRLPSGSCYKTGEVVFRKPYAVRGTGRGGFDTSEPGTEIIDANSTGHVLAYRSRGRPLFENFSVRSLQQKTGFADIVMVWGGTDYAVGDVVTLGAGSHKAGVCSTPPQITITGVSPSATATTTAATVVASATPDTLTVSFPPGGIIYPKMGVIDTTSPGALSAGTYVVAAGGNTGGAMTIKLSRPVTSTGVGLGDTLQFGASIMGAKITERGVCSIIPIGTVDQASTTGSGTGAHFGVIWGGGAGLSISGVGTRLTEDALPGATSLTVDDPTGFIAGNNQLWAQLDGTMFEMTGTTTSGSALVTDLVATKGLTIGTRVYGVTIPPNTTIADVTSATSVTLSTAALSPTTVAAQLIFDLGASSNSGTITQSLGVASVVGNTINLMTPMLATASAGNHIFAEYARDPMVRDMHARNTFEPVHVYNSPGVRLDNVIGQNSTNAQLYHKVSPAFNDAGDDHIGGGSKGWDFTFGEGVSCVEINAGFEGKLEGVKCLGAEYHAYLNLMFGPTGTFQIYSGSYEEAYYSNFYFRQGVPLIPYANIIGQGIQVSNFSNTEASIIRIEPGYAPPERNNWVEVINWGPNLYNTINLDGSRGLHEFLDGSNGSVQGITGKLVSGCCALIYMFKDNAADWTMDPGQWGDLDIKRIWGTTSFQNWSNITMTRRTGPNKLINQDMQIDQKNEGGDYTTSTNNSAAVTNTLDGWVVGQKTTDALVTTTSRGSGIAGGTNASLKVVTTTPVVTPSDDDYLVVYQPMDAANVIDIKPTIGAGSVSNVCWTALVETSVTGNFGTWISSGETFGVQSASYTQHFSTVAGVPKRIGFCAQMSAFINLGGTTSVGSPIVTGMASTTGLLPGNSVASSRVPTGTTILSVDSPTQITLTANATSAGSTPMTFSIGSWPSGLGTTGMRVGFALAAGLNYQASSLAGFVQGPKFSPTGAFTTTPSPLLTTADASFEISDAALVKGDNPPLYYKSRGLAPNRSTIGELDWYSPLEGISRAQQRFRKSYPDGTAVGTARGTNSSVTTSGPTGNLSVNWPIVPRMPCSPTLKTYDHLGAINKVSHFTGSWISGITPSTVVANQNWARLQHQGAPATSATSLSFEYTLSCELQ